MRAISNSVSLSNWVAFCSRQVLSHWRKDCPHKDKTCSVCGKVGHLKATCRAEGGDASSAGLRAIPEVLRDKRKFLKAPREQAATRRAGADTRSSGKEEEEVLPDGWKKVASKSRPGTFAYLNTHTGEKIGWRPAVAASTRRGDLPPVPRPEEIGVEGDDRRGGSAGSYGMSSEDAEEAAEATPEEQDRQRRPNERRVI